MVRGRYGNEREKRLKKGVAEGVMSLRIVCIRGWSYLLEMRLGVAGWWGAIDDNRLEAELGVTNETCTDWEGVKVSGTM